MKYLSRAIRSLVENHAPVRQRFFLKKQYSKFKKSSLYHSVRRRHFRIKAKLIKRFFSYTPSQLEHKLRTMGLTDGDTVLMHSSFNIHNGFQGEPRHVIDCVLAIIGAGGNLVMVSMPYTGSSFAYLKDRPIFDVRRMPSRMGIITEVFRTEKGVVRSLSPSHPMLAFGPKAKWIIADHEKVMYPCGNGSPFEKILKLNAKGLLFDMSPKGISTFFHHVEDTFKDHLPVKLYDDEPLKATVIDSTGNRIEVASYVFSREARYTRDPRLLKRQLLRNSVIRRSKIGNTKITLFALQQVVDCAANLVKEKNYLYKARLRQSLPLRHLNSHVFSEKNPL